METIYTDCNQQGESQNVTVTTINKTHLLI